MTSATRATLRVLRAGSVPDEGIERLTVGAQDLVDFTGGSLAALASAGRPPPLFLNGEWGTGKTHSLRLIRSLALRDGFATMEAVLNARTCPPNYPQRIFPVVTRNVAHQHDRGIRSVIGSLMQDDKRASLALQAAWGRSQVDIWQAVSTLRGLASRGETALLGTSSAWRVLTGSDIAQSDYGYRRIKAMHRLHWITSFLRSLGVEGTVLLFDELETIDQLWNRRSRATAYDVLGNLLDAPGAWCVFGITERFLRLVHEDARSDLFTQASPAAKRFLSIWRHGDPKLISPPIVGEPEARTLARVVQGMYRKAYPDTKDCSADCQGAIADWSRNASRNPRRLVRSIVDACDRARPFSTGSFAI